MAARVRRSAAVDDAAPTWPTAAEDEGGGRQTWPDVSESPSAVSAAAGASDVDPAEAALAPVVVDMASEACPMRERKLVKPRRSCSKGSHSISVDKMIESAHVLLLTSGAAII